MPLFSKKNKNIGDQLTRSAQAVFDQAADRREQYVNKATWSAAEVTNYFLKVGLDHKGDLQSYTFEKGSSTSVEVKIDLVALAAACAGAPMPETPLFAEVGAKVTVEKTKNNLLIAAVAPGELGDLTVPRRVVFLGMTGYRFTAKLTLSLEIGVKTPDVPGIPKLSGGELGSESPDVSKGTYAELVAFELGAKASYKSEISLSGTRLYVSDPAPTYLTRHLNGSTGSTVTELREVLQETLTHGDKKEAIKTQILELLGSDPKLRAFKPEPNWWKRNISGGNITAATLLEALDKARTAAASDPDAIVRIDDVAQNLRNYKEQEVLKPYNFLALWSVNPEGSAGFSATATASVKVGVGVAGAGAEASATVAGPALSVSGKYSYFRIQVAALGQSRGRARSGGFRGSSPPRPYTPAHYAVMTQDTRIVYGQVNVRLAGVGAKVAVGASQGVLAHKGQQEKTLAGSTDEARGKHGTTRGYVTGKLGLEETSIEAGGEATWKYDLLNYMYYESATALWSPPPDPGAKDGEERKVQLARGSGYSFGQSVTIGEVVAAVKRTGAQGELDGYLQGLANCLGVAHSQMKEFVDSIGWLLEAFGEQPDPNARPEAFLVEASFVPTALPEVACRWKKGRWMLGPYGVLSGTLRSVVIPSEHRASSLQAIRLRYRIADSENKRRTRFSLGFKYIGSLGVQLESVENAGSEGIVNLGTQWFGSFARYNTLPNQTQAHEEAVPQVALLHQ